jgi:MuDR family transposase
LLVTGRTERHHPVEALNNFETFDRLSANESLLGLDDKLAENKIFALKSTLNWIIYDLSVRKNVQCWVQKSYKTRLIMKCKEKSCPWRLYARLEEGDHMEDHHK